jgi:shikimate kinase
MTDEIVLPHSVRKAHSAMAVALVGFMGAGKTTVGQALALQLGWRFIDLDKLIEIREGCSIEQIFQESGESFFRRVEHALLRDSLEALSDPTVLALGGGAFAQAANCELLASANVPVVFLDAPIEELFRRCEQPGVVVRPLRRSLDEFRELYNYRRPSYRKAQLQIATGNREISSIGEEIISGLGLIPASGAE